MRIGVLAQAAGTTARAVRHYHRLGLLPEPTRTSSGYRDYSMTDLVRLMRIRRLASSGIPLGSVAALTSGTDRNDVVDDLEELVTGIEREQKVLETKKLRLLALLDDAKAGRPLTALPRPLADRMAALIDTSDGVARTELERERDHLEVLALSGGLPDQMAIVMTDTLRERESVTSYLAVLERWAALTGMNPTSASHEIDSLADDLVTLLHDVDFTGAQTNDEPMHLDVDDIVPDPAQRAVLLRVMKGVSG